ncbi:MAG: metallophosphoesterase, partial [Clostridium sp.]|nr:metallophosphoesterase [Clostridium sp.]
NNERLLSAIRECRPDFIVVAGDIPTAKPKKSLDVAVSFMEELAKEYPVYYGNGNHEHRMKLYPQTYGDMAEKYEEALKKCGINRLVNEHIVLAEYGIVIYGSEIDRCYYKRFHRRFMDEDYMESILGKCPGGQYGILIAHNPDYFEQYAAWGADLVFSGHVHGGIVRIPFLKKGVASPTLCLFPEYSGGMYKKDKSTMILSRGLGMHTIPIRLFNPGEVSVVELKGE